MHDVSVHNNAQASPLLILIHVVVAQQPPLGNDAGSPPQESPLGRHDAVRNEDNEDTEDGSADEAEVAQKSNIPTTNTETLTPITTRNIFRRFLLLIVVVSSPT